MYKYSAELANKLDIMPTDASSPPQSVTVRCEVSPHRKQDNDPKNVRHYEYTS